MDHDDFMMDELEEDEKRRKYGLPERWMLLEPSGASILKEENGLALIRFTDSGGPSCEHPDTYQIRREGGEVLWDSGITYMGEYIHEGVSQMSVSRSLREDAQERFRELSQQKEARPTAAGWIPVSHESLS